HGLYANACFKGEECIPLTWDIFHEKWGWMLIFWNLVGVPYVYCFNSFYLLQNGPIEHSTAYTVMLFVLLVGAYYIWDTSQSQRQSASSRSSTEERRPLRSSAATAARGAAPPAATPRRRRSDRTP